MTVRILCHVVLDRILSIGHNYYVGTISIIGVVKLDTLPEVTMVALSFLIGSVLSIQNIKF